MSEVRLHDEAARLARKGRPWFYADDVITPLPAAGLAWVRDEVGRPLGLGVVSPGSRLALRLAGGWPGDELPTFAEFLRARLAAAAARRAGWIGARSGVRLVHGEADGVPGLVVDWYGGVAVVQVTSAAIEEHVADLVQALLATVEPRTILARNDVAVRRFEGLEQFIRLLHGPRVDEVRIVEDGVEHPVHPFEGQKTGFYLDQRPARAFVKAHAAGRRVLDLFAYQGAFALHALAGGARAALAIDQSAAALAVATAAATANRLDGLTTRSENAFEALRTLRSAGEQFELVVVDPPAFAKSRREVRGAERGYRDLNRLALRLLAPGGMLVTCSCSHHVTLPHFEDIARQATADLPFRMALRARLGAGDDHPVWIALPESEYLKVLVLERLD